MVDTVTLLLSDNNFHIMDPAAFSPSADGLLKPLYAGGYRLGSRGFMCCYQNPTKGELKRGIYKPCLTLTKRHVGKGQYPVTLKIQTSLPKLLYRNNFDEVTEQDFPQIIKELQTVLLRMFVHITPEQLIAATIQGIHYSKNITLTDYTTCSMLLRPLELINMNERLDINKTDFRNRGQAVRYHANSFEFILYDKIKDLQQAQKGRKRSIDQDNDMQLHLLPELLARKPYEVLRLEYRLNTPAKIDAVLETIGANNDRSFYSLFQKNIARKALQSVWEPIEQELRSLAFDPNNPANLLDMIRRTHPKMKPAKTLQICAGLLLKQSMGARALRNSLGLFGQKSGRWYKLMKDMRTINVENSGFYPFAEINKQLAAFEKTSLNPQPRSTKYNAYYEPEIL